MNAEIPTVKKPFFKRSKSCPFSGPDAMEIDWKDVKMLSKFISERGKMMPSRITNVSMKKQRELSRAIKRARYMGLMAYVRTETDSY
ncbi:MAG: 30S ribosomal protein S18 [Rhodospirillales bacterium]|nr:30S ribosomal protein S18 [Rhodospirillales bacterium]